MGAIRRRPAGFTRADAERLLDWPAHGVGTRAAARLVWAYTEAMNLAAAFGAVLTILIVLAILVSPWIWIAAAVWLAYAVAAIRWSVRKVRRDRAARARRALEAPPSR